MIQTECVTVCEPLLKYCYFKFSCAEVCFPRNVLTPRLDMALLIHMFICILVFRSASKSYDATFDAGPGADARPCLRQVLLTASQRRLVRVWKVWKGGPFPQPLPFIFKKFQKSVSLCTRSRPLCFWLFREIDIFRWWLVKRSAPPLLKIQPIHLISRKDQKHVRRDQVHKPAQTFKIFKNVWWWGEGVGGGNGLVERHILRSDVVFFDHELFDFAVANISGESVPT